MTSQPLTEGELLFLTDSAYLSLIDEQSTRPSNGKQKHDGLFLERLDSFIEGQMRDIAAFADREQHSLDEIRKLVAIPHAKLLFSSQKDPTNDNVGTSSVRSTLARLSSDLQTLNSIAGLHSLLLAVAPASSPPPSISSTATPAEVSWIGGTELGKEFWMGLKGGGLAGVRAFRAKCRAAEASVSTPSHSRSVDIKTELNAAVRHALRTASGNPSAEMRWTRPAALEDAYGVRLRGWPAGILRRNPSNNTMRENRQLLECIRSGSMRFVLRESAEWDEAALELETETTTMAESRRVEELRGAVHSRASVLPVASASSPRTITSLSTTPSQPEVPHPVAPPRHPAHTKAVKRPVEPEDAQDRRMRRRTDSG